MDSWYDMRGCRRRFAFPALRFITLKVWFGIAKVRPLPIKAWLKTACLFFCIKHARGKLVSLARCLTY